MQKGSEMSMYRESCLYHEQHNVPLFALLLASPSFRRVAFVMDPL